MKYCILLFLLSVATLQAHAQTPVIRVHPNPFTDSLTIVVDSANNDTIVIFITNLLGVEVARPVSDSVVQDSLSLTLATDTFPAGRYIIHFWVNQQPAGGLLAVKESPTTSERIPLDQHTIRIYPNPFREQLTLEPGDHCTDCTYTLFDVYGRVQRMGTLPASLYTENLPPGFYIVRISGPSGMEHSVRRLIKQP
ncbi:MAG: T9SS type A sorting domain-containing protein [Leptolyngbya sp. SIO3F4]|nr:T9SS type A sorting domain-containing protein [Leptolyngbya sp. SIO3F4]